MNTFKINYPIIATTLFVAIICVAHIGASDQYDWTKNTISDLAAQGYKRRAIMQIGLFSFGSVVWVGSLLNGLCWRNLPILVYGLCVALTGIFSTRPFTGDAPYSALHASLHSLFAQGAGIAFSAAIVVELFLARDWNGKAVHLAFLGLVVGFSLAFGLLTAYQGIAQRLLYAASLTWLVWFSHR